MTTVHFGFLSMVYGPPAAGDPTGTAAFTEASAQFLSESGTAFGNSNGLVSVGSCTSTESLTSTTANTGSLNAGTITVNDPNGVAAVALVSEGSGSYGSQLPGGFLTVAGGTFQFTATAGTTAPAVGAFSTSINFPTPLLNWTNPAADATVVRSQGVTVTWTGGSPGTYVFITGNSSSGSVSGSFVCFAPVAAGTFTVPSYVLGTLPASASGSLEVVNETALQFFTATGLDYGYAIGEVGFNNNATYQ
jgi:hypothetical protein